MHFSTDKDLFHISASFAQLNYLGSILDKSSQAFVLFDTSDKVRFINRGFRKLLGYTQEDVVNLKWDEDISTPESHFRDMKIKQKLLRSGQAQRYEKEYRRKDGNLIPVELLMHAVMHKEEILFYALITDIRARKKAEQEGLDREISTKKQMRYWNNLLNNMNKLFYTYDNKYMITYVNQKSVEILGFTPEEIIGNYLWDFVPERLRAEFQKSAQTHIPSSKEGSMLITLMDKQGDEHIIKFSTAPIYEETKIVGEMALAEDITVNIKVEKDLFMSNQDLSKVEIELTAANQQLMATEEELRYQLEELEDNKKRLDDAHQQLAAILDFLPDATAVINREGKVTLWNQAMEQLTGVEAKDVLGKGNYEYSLPFYGQRQPTLIDRVLIPAAERAMEFSMADKQNRVLSLEKYFPLIAGGAFLDCKASRLLDPRGQLVGDRKSVV